MIDFGLAFLHHLLVFGLAATLAVELALVRPLLTDEAVRRLGRIDAAYGALALAVIAIGVGRLLFGVRGWEFYVFFWAFWGKMGTFVLVGLMSIPPTLAFRRWSRSLATGSKPPVKEIAVVRRWIVAQIGAFPLILAFAAAMARGIGY